MRTGAESAAALRVLHVVPAFLPRSQTFIYTQLKSMPEIDQTVVTRRRLNASEFPFEPVIEADRLAATDLGGKVLRRTRRLVPGSSLLARRTARAARRRGANVIHAHFGITGPEALWAARRVGAPLVTAFHGHDVYSPRLRPTGAGRLYDELFRHGTIFTCVGPRAAAHLISIGCPAARVRVVPVGLDLASFPYRPSVPEGPFVLLQASRLVEKKGVDVTLRAFARVAAELPQAELWIAGDGPRQAQLEALARRLGVSARVRFLGALSHADMRAAMARAHLGVQPSRVAPSGDREGTPTVLLEMQALGVDVVASDHADIASIVADPSQLVPEEDHDALADLILARAAGSAADRRARLDAGRALVEARHDAVAIAAQLGGIYREARQLVPASA